MRARNAPAVEGTGSSHWDSCSPPGSAARKMLHVVEEGELQGGERAPRPGGLGLRAGDPPCQPWQTRCLRRSRPSPPSASPHSPSLRHTRPGLASPHLSTPPPASPLLSTPPPASLRLTSAHRTPPPLHSPRPSHLTGRAGKHGPSPQSTPWRKQVQDCWPEGGKNKNVRPEKGPRRFPSAAAASSPRSGVRGACGCLPGWRQRLLRVRYRWAASSA